MKFNKFSQIRQQSQKCTLLWSWIFILHYWLKNKFLSAMLLRKTNISILSIENDLTSCFRDKIEAIMHWELLQGPHLPTTRSLNLPVSAFVLASFLPVTLRALRASPPLGGPMAPGPSPSFRLHYSLSLLCLYPLPFYPIVLSSKQA